MRIMQLKFERFYICDDVNNSTILGKEAVGFLFSGIQVFYGVSPPLVLILYDFLQISRIKKPPADLIHWRLSRY